MGPDHLPHPHWPQVKVNRSALQQEQLLLALVQQGSTPRLLHRAALPLGHLRPGVHYPIKLLLGAEGAGPHLYLTLCLQECPHQQLEALQGCDAELQV